MKDNTTIQRIFKHYRKFESFKSNESKFEAIQVSFKMFEAIAKFRMTKYYNRYLNSFWRNATHLTNEAELAGEENFYLSNQNFIYKFRKARNSKSHDSVEVQNIDIQLVRKKTYEHLVEFLRSETKLNLPDEFVGYTKNKPDRLVEWINEQIFPDTSVSTQIPKAQEKKPTQPEVNKEPSPHVESTPTNIDKEDSQPTSIEKSTFWSQPKVVYPIVSLATIVAAIGIWYMFSDDQNQSSQSNKEVSRIEKQDSLSTKSEVKEPAINEDRVAPKPTKKQFSASPVKETEHQETPQIREKRVREKSEQPQIGGNQVIIGSGSTVGGNVSGGNMTITNDTAK